jgi:PKD repeat protein
MKKNLFTKILMFSVILFTHVQANAQRECGTMQHHEYLKQTRPNYETERAQYEQMINQYLINKANNAAIGKTSGTNAIVTIPVVVHVVYNTAAENITNAQAASQVQVLNDDFAKLNADASKVTQPTFSTIASGAQIRFCLAQRDPNGNATTGVVHYSTTVTSFGTNDAVKSAASGGADPWDVTKYVNLWVCDLSSTLLGYGEFPTGSISQTWGLVVDYAYTGSGGSAQAPYNLGRTGTHEFGHCFNLYHIWGDDGTACSGSDQCNDTPNQAGEHYGCFTQGSIQTDACSPSSPGTMWMNFMDYTDDACMYMFTANQVARMEAVVNNPPWNVLATSNGCTPVSALDAGITSIINPLSGSSTCNNNVTPKITLNNSGSTTITSATILYRMDAMPTQTLNWSGSLASGASTVVTLNTYSGLSNASHTFSSSVVNPNGTPDGNASNNSLTSTFTVIAAPVGSPLPFTQNFNSGTTPPTGWVIQKANTIDATVSWSVVPNTTGLVAGSTHAARMDNYSSNSDIHGQIDALRSPAISFAGANSSLNVTFDVAYRPYATTNYIDTLNVYISTDCGSTWTRLYTKGGAQLQTVAGTQTVAFTPTANAQWRRETVSLTSYSAQPVAYLKFESVSGYGNNVWLDNINVTYTTAAAPPVASFSTSSTRCVGQSITFTDASTNSPTSWTWSFPGGTPSSSTVQNPTVTYTAAGTYTITHTAANSSGTSTPVSSTISVSSNPTVVASNTTVCRGSAVSITASGATTYSWNTGATTASISVSPTITTNYTVVGTNASGCSNTRTLSVTVNSTPTVAASNTTICRGSSTSLSASGATTYSWNTGATTASISVSPTVTTNYTVTGTTTGCSNTKTLSVTVNPTPTVAVSSATVCRGTAANLTASGATTYSWNTGATTASISVTPTTNTTYTVTGTSTGCSNTRTVSVTVRATPTVSASNKTICIGSSTSLSASGASTYTWNTGATTASISVSPTVTTNYTVVGTNTLGCTNTKTVSVTVNTLPNVTATSATICAGATATISASGASTYTWNTGSNSANLSDSPSSNTTYTVTGTSSAGCVKSATASISVGSAPVITVNSATICSGSTATLTASGVTTYTWNTSSNASNISVNPTSTTIYTVNGNLTGCSVGATQTATVTVNNLPNVVMSSITSPLCVNGSAVSLSATPGGGTFTGVGVTGNSFNPSVSGVGTFTVIYNYTDANGCSASDSKTVSVSACTGIATLSSSNVSIYPNPTKDIINVVMDASFVNNASIEMYDAIGKLIVSEKIINTHTTINTDHLAKGIYTIRIVSEGKQISNRIIKE